MAAKEDDEQRSYLGLAALGTNFDLTNEEFGRIFDRPPKNQLSELNELAMYAGDLRLCLHQAIFDILSSNKIGDFDISDSDVEYATSARRHRDHRVWKLTRDHKFEDLKEVRELQVYHLAERAVPWSREQAGYGPGDDLGLFKAGVVEDDTWGTFMKMWDIAEEQGLSQNQAQLLPDPSLSSEIEWSFFEDWGGEDWLIDEADACKSPSVELQRKMAGRLEAEIKRELLAASEGGDRRFAGLVGLIGRVAGYQSAASRISARYDHDITARVDEVSRDLRWLKIGVVVAIILLAIVIGT
jgi:hypothetical protein